MCCLIIKSCLQKSKQLLYLNQFLIHFESKCLFRAFDRLLQIHLSFVKAFIIHTYNKMTNLSLILFNFNFPMPLISIGILSLAVALFFKLKTSQQSFYNSISLNYQQILAGKSQVKISDSYLSFCFYSLLFVKLCVRLYIVYMSSR